MNSLPLPPLLEQLIAAGRWPRTRDEALRQNRVPLVALERIRALAPEEHGLYLYRPPFRTVRSRLAKEQPFWSDPMADPAGIDVDLTLLIGDFGLGSDAPIVLDYRLDPTNPRVLRLQWSQRGTANRWVVAAPDFATFAAILGL